MLDDACPEPAGRILPDVLTKDQLYMIWPPQIKIVPDYIFKELSSLCWFGKKPVSCLSPSAKWRALAGSRKPFLVGLKDKADVVANGQRKPGFVQAPKNLRSLAAVRGLDSF
ncbi:MAG TPA: hypothetical protein GXX35_13225 [Thermoanaerobacterales bacterium]|nr:hypothetical protein [Thermoanaerobacterales bacterium]